MKKFVASALLVLGLGAVPAQAAPFQFLYQASFGTFSGTLDGTLQADNNTVLVNSLGAIAFDGVTGPALSELTTADIFYGGSRAPAVTFDGSLVDFMGCTDSSCLDGIVFDPDVIAFLYPVLSVGPSYGGSLDPSGYIQEEFIAANWRLFAVPEPAALALLAAGLAGAAGLRRRARRRTF